MTVFILQSLALLLVAFLVGCFIGCLFRRAAGSDQPEPVVLREVKQTPAETSVAAEDVTAGAVAEQAASSDVDTGRDADGAQTAASQEPAPGRDDPESATETEPVRGLWRADIAEETLILTGGVPTIATRDRVLATARSVFPDMVVHDRTRSDGAADAGDWIIWTEFALRQLSACVTGRATIDDDKALSLSGTVKDAEALEAVLERVRGERPEGLGLATLDLVAIREQAPSDTGDPPDRATSEDAGTAGDAGHPGRRPETLSGPRAGSADDLRKIKGIGQVNKSRLNELGIWHFDQIARWTQDEVTWVDGYLSFRGRIDREDWIGQAAALAERTGADDPNETD